MHQDQVYKRHGKHNKGNTQKLHNPQIPRTEKAGQTARQIQTQVKREFRCEDNTKASPARLHASERRPTQGLTIQHNGLAH